MPPNTNPFRSLGWTDEEWLEFIEQNAVTRRA